MRYDHLLERVARTAGIIAIFLGISALLGWILDIALLKSLLPGLATMKVNAALSFTLAGVSLLFHVEQPSLSKKRTRIAQVCALFTIALAILTLGEYLLGVSFGIDQILIHALAEEVGTPYPGRMAPNTALCFSFIGIALLLLHSTGHTLRTKVVQLLAIVVFLIAFVAIIGYMYNVAELYRVVGYSSMALHTAIGFALLSIGVLVSRPQHTVVAILAQDNLAGSAARRILPMVIAALIVLGGLWLEGQRAGYYGTEIGMALMIVISTTIFTFLILWNAHLQGIAEKDQVEMARLVDAVKDYAIYMLDPSGIVMTWNHGAERLKGYQPVEVIGRYFSCFYTERDRESGKPERALEIAALNGRYEENGWRVRKNGSKFQANLILTAMRNSRGDLVGFTEVTQDITERVQATEQLRVALEGSPVGMMTVDQRGEIVLVNLQMEKLFGHMRKELIGQQVEMLIPHRYRKGHRDLREGFFAAPVNRPMGAGRDLYGLRKDGTEVPVEVALTSLHTMKGHFVLCSITDITERKRAQEERDDLAARRIKVAELSATLRERETLLQEIHHRVKNNLQVVSSLVNLQLARITEKASHDALDACRTRIRAIALIHEMLYQSQNYLQVPFSEYVHHLCTNVFNILGGEDARISLTLDLADVSLHVDKAVPCGLIMNELITNAVKHAFPNNRRGEIRVELGRIDSERLWIAVSDNGVGMQSDVDIWTSMSLGMQLIRALAKQIKAEILVGHEGGTSFKLVFPAEEQRV